MKNIVVLRTNSYSERWHEILLNLTSQFKVIVVADNRFNDFSYDGLETIYYTEKTISELGLLIAEDMQWRFGDYVLYLADQYAAIHNYDYEYIWLLEPDVFIDFNDVCDFFGIFEKCDHDFLSSYFTVSDNGWMWNKYLNAIGHDIGYKTFFPLVRVSSYAIKYLLQQRKSFRTLANDEVFVATKLFFGNFKIATFNDESSIKYDRNSFSYRLPHYLPIVKALGGADIYHPIFDCFSSYMSHLIIKGSWKKVLKRFVGDNNSD